VLITSLISGASSQGHARIYPGQGWPRHPVQNEHIEGDGPTVFAHACKLGLEGIVSKQKDSDYRSGRSPDWLKMKNPAAAAVKREAEEEWGKKK
jgi:ATP-dependent DNA ligase